MHLRRVTVVLALSLAGTGLGAVPADAACAAAPPRISLTAFHFMEGPSRFYLGEEGATTQVHVLIAGGCNGASISTDFATSPGTAVPGSDYDHVSSPPSISATPPNDGSEVKEQPVSIKHEGEPEAIIESLQFTLSNPQSTGAGVPTLIIPSAPILIVDSDGASRVGFEGIPYSQSETFAAARIPVFRAGEVTGPTTVDYVIEPSGSNPATPGEDYTAASPGTLSFGDTTERVKWIDLTVVNDQLAESPEEVTITLTGPEVATPASTTFTILDNEENVFPKSRFHHPRHKWKYKKSDFRIREFHVFATDEGGSGVVAAELALRRNLMNGKCAWKTRKGWQKKDCSNRTWLPTKYDDAGQLFYYRMKQLKSSVGTKIKNYTAFSRAVDGAGNVEKDFIKKRNDNTFEIKRTKKRR